MSAFRIFRVLHRVYPSYSERSPSRTSTDIYGIAVRLHIRFARPFRVQTFESKRVAVSWKRALGRSVF